MAVTAHTAASLAAARMELPFTDEADFVNARRGFLAPLTERILTATDGRVLWDLDAYGDVTGECPASVHPSLWRQAQLVLFHGLFEVVPGIYQVRGQDLSNMTLVEGTTGVIVIDPLVTTETAAAALDLYRSVRGDRPVTAVIYTHSHVDHFGGVAGVLPDSGATGIPIVAPEHFVEHAASENLHAGTAMARRAGFMYGTHLPKGPWGQMTCGLGPEPAAGRVSLVPPTIEITTTGQRIVIDGVPIEFQMTPGTEAPAEMNFHFPDHRALCMSENATHNMHNVLTLRGAQVRDARDWARFLDESIDLFADRSDVAFASHHWPTWGREAIVDHLSKQRDLYAFIHDQTLRYMNKGYTGIEIAEELRLPPSLARSWHCRGYYGSLNHNVKAVYQRYMGWFDGNPAHLWPHTPENSAVRYVEYMGGADAVLERAQRSFDDGDYRWVAEVVNHVVFAEPTNDRARTLLAEAYRQMAYASENATWRNFFLTGAQELTEGVAAIVPRNDVFAMLSQLSVRQVFEVVSIRLIAERADDDRFLIEWALGDTDEVWTARLSNGVFSAALGRRSADVDLRIETTRGDLLFLVLGFLSLDQAVASGSTRFEGDPSVLSRLHELIDSVDPAFPIVTP